MVAETVNDLIPERSKPLDHESLAERNPNVVNHQVATGKVRALQVVRNLQRFGVLSESLEERLAGRRVGDKGGIGSRSFTSPPYPPRPRWSGHGYQGDVDSRWTNSVNFSIRKGSLGTTPQVSRKRLSSVTIRSTYVACT